MALTMRTEAPGQLMPTQSVQQYQGQVLSGGTSGQPLPRQVMQSTVPKIPYAAKTGSGAMPTGYASGIFGMGGQTNGAETNKRIAARVRAEKAAAEKAAAQKALPSTAGAQNTWGAKLGAVGTNYGSGGQGTGAYGLTAQAGGRLQALQSAYKQHFGSDLPVISGGRSRAEQTDLYNLYLSGRGNLAAKPGTSVHETGKAVDFGGAAHGYSPQQSWLVYNAPSFGWTWAGKNFSQVEPWHFEFNG